MLDSLYSPSTRSKDPTSVTQYHNLPSSSGCTLTEVFGVPRDSISPPHHHHTTRTGQQEHSNFHKVSWWHKAVIIILPHQLSTLHGTVGFQSPIPNAFFPILAEAQVCVVSTSPDTSKSHSEPNVCGKQVITPFFIVLRFTNQRLLTSDATPSGKVSSLHVKS